MLALAQGESEIRGDDVMNALAGEEAKLPTANVAAAARRHRDGMVFNCVGRHRQSIDWLSALLLVPPLFLEISPFYRVTIGVGKGISRDPGRGICMAQTALLRRNS